MTNVNQVRDSLKDYARDIKLNLGQVLTAEGAPGLTDSQIWQIAYATALSTRSQTLIDAIAADAATSIDDTSREAAKAASTIMGMNNIYYRFLHLTEDPQFKSMPAKLRMNVIAKPGVSKVDFELMCLAVSALSGCGMCINAHIEELKKVAVSAEAIQSSVRIASVINAAAQALSIG